MGILAFLILNFAPGCWLSFALHWDGLSMRSRVCLAMALSPAIVALQLILLDAAGMSFAAAAKTVLIANAFAPLLVLRFPRSTDARNSEMPFVAGVVAIAATLAIILWRSWYFWPSFALFSWHSIFHTDLCYAATARGVIPEVPGMAGYGTAYPFFLHYFWAALSWFLDRPPNLVYQATNLVWLFLTALLTYDAARMLGCRPATAVASVAIVFSGNSFPAAVVEALRSVLVPFAFNHPDSPFSALLQTPIFASWGPYLGDPRFNSYWQKFYSFTVMPGTLPLVSALFLAAGGMVASRDRSWGAMLAAILAALGLLYPTLAPPVYVAAVVTVFVAASVGGVRSMPRELVGRGLWVVAAALIVGAVWGPLVAARSGRALSLASPTKVAVKLIRASIALAPCLVLAAPLLWRRRTRQDPALLLLAGAVVGATAMYVFAELEAANEYKWLFVAGAAVSLLAARTFDLLQWRARTIVLVALVLTVANAAVNRIRFRQMTVQHVMAYAFPDAEADEFWLQLKAPEVDREWLAALRDKTPEDTVLVDGGSSVPYYAFARRSEYVALDRGKFGRVGYGMRMPMIVTKVHGVPTQAFAERRDQVRLLFNAQDAKWGPGLLESLRSLRRPLALRFEAADHPILRWLREHRIGVPLLEGDQGALWFIPVEDRR